MSLLISLPSDITSLVIAKWLWLSSVTKLDSAYCNVLERKFFLNLLSSNKLLHCETISISKWDVPNCTFKAWLLKRRLHVEGIEFTTITSMSDQSIELLNMSKDRLTQLTYTDGRNLASILEEQFFLSFINHCPMMKELQISYVNVSEDFMDTVQNKVWKSLTCLELINFKNPSVLNSASFAKIANTTSSLTKCVISGGFVGFSFMDFLALIRNNHQLEHISFNIDMDSFTLTDLIIELRPHAQLKYIFLSLTHNQTYLDLSDICHLLNLFESIRYVQIESACQGFDEYFRFELGLKEDDKPGVDMITLHNIRSSKKLLIEFIMSFHSIRNIRLKNMCGIDSEFLRVMVGHTKTSLEGLFLVKIGSSYTSADILMVCDICSLLQYLTIERNEVLGIVYDLFHKYNNSDSRTLTVRFK